MWRVAFESVRISINVCVCVTLGITQSQLTLKFAEGMERTYEAPSNEAPHSLLLGTPHDVPARMLIFISVWSLVLAKPGYGPLHGFEHCFMEFRS